MRETVLEFERLSFGVLNYSELLERLEEVKAKAKSNFIVEITGSYEWGYSLDCRWERPATDEEIEKNRVNKERADNASKEMRRQQYEKLKAEFGGETD
jgi:hypothetical protein